MDDAALPWGVGGRRGWLLSLEGVRRGLTGQTLTRTEGVDTALQRETEKERGGAGRLSSSEGKQERIQ